MTLLHDIINFYVQFKFKFPQFILLTVYFYNLFYFWVYLLEFYYLSFVDKKFNEIVI
jgi:hypothetical protein